MSCDIFIRSYYKDFAWLVYCLQSIKKYCRDFNKIILVVPHSSRRKLDWMGLSGDVTITCCDYPDDYLGQQITKLSADQFSDADYICHIDSDCLFQKYVTPEDLLVDGKPQVLMSAYSQLDPRTPWKSVTERFLSMEVHYEFMRTPPYTYPRWVYSALRNYAFELHGETLDNYIIAQPNRGFSEFNALGAYAYAFHRQEFFWNEVGLGGSLPDFCRVHWSWGGINAEVLSGINKILQESD
jgi:hypothetical protein